MQFHKVVIHFGNGEQQNVHLRNVISDGGESRVIDVIGDNRVISSVEFWYDAQSLGRNGLVRLFGKD